jgi:MtrB/PioB family decaheme-associated outer membrane protein
MQAKLFRIPLIMLLTLWLPLSLAADDDEEKSEHEPPSCKYCPEDEGWIGTIDIGLARQNNDDDHFGRFDGHNEKGTEVVGNAEMFYRDEDGVFGEVFIDVISDDAATLDISGGHQGLYEVGLEYRDMPNYREHSASSPYLEAGDGELVLPSGWVPGTTTQDMTTLADDVRSTPLRTEREQTTVNFAYFPAKRWKISGYVKQEEKQGTKDFGATFGFNQTVILPLPVDYQTDNLGLSLDYNGEAFQYQLNLTTSQFKNNIHQVDWQNPYESVASDTATGQLAADSPDNEFSQLSAILGYRISDSIRISGKLASGSLKQNEKFLPYTINPSIATTALPSDNLDGKVDTSLASVQLDARPMPGFRVDASYSVSERDNQTDSYVFDPVVTDSGLGGARMSRPYSFDQNLLKIKLGYRFSSGLNLSGGIDDDTMKRDYSTVEETQDQTLWVKFKAQPVDSLDASIKLSSQDRNASDYVPLSDQDLLLDYPNANYYNNELLRMHNMADRTRNRVELELAYMASDATTLGFNVETLQDDYDDMYLGLQKGDGLIYTLSLSSMLSETLTTSLFYTHDSLESDQAGSEKLIASDPENLWVVSDSNVTDSFGVSFNWIAIEDELDIGAELSYSDFTGKVEYSAAADLPELGARLTAVSINGNYLLSEDEDMKLHFEVRYEKFQEDNWSDDGVVNSLPTLLSLGTAESDTSTTLALVSLRFKF